MTFPEASVILSSLKINRHDPRANQQFLQFSHDMHQWQNYINEAGWWLQREHDCLDLFRDYGFDLLSGGWYCLIGYYRRGWLGVSPATVLFANGFSCSQPACWPPIAAKTLRRQMLDSFGQSVLPLMHQLPITSLNCDTHQQLLVALSALEKQAIILQSPQLTPLRLFIAKMKNHANAANEMNVRTHSVGSVIPFDEKAQNKPLFAMSSSLIGKKISYLRTFCYGGVIGSLLTLLISFSLDKLNDPGFVAFSNQVWPNNPWYKLKFQNYQQLSQSLPINPSKKQLETQLENLEKRLIASEQRTKPYITVSELKTEIYQLSMLVQQKPTKIEDQLITLQTRKNNHIPIPEEKYLELKNKLESLNARLILLEYQ